MGSRFLVSVVVNSRRTAQMSLCRNEAQVFGVGAGWSRALYGRRSSVRYSGASAFDLVMKAAWDASSRAGGGSVRDVTG
jgi:hypothetical protein